MVDVRELIMQKIATYPKRVFALVINNDIVISSENRVKPKLVKVRYRKGRCGTELKIGTYCKVGTENKLEHSDGIVERIKRTLCQTWVGNVDLESYISDPNNIEVTVHADFNVISITTPAYRIAKEVAMKSKNGMQKGSINGAPIEVSTMNDIYDWFQKYAIDSYFNVLKYILMRKLKEAKDLKFYFTLDAFVPVMVYAESNSFLFNPFIYLPRYMDEFSKSQIYDIGSKTQANYYNITVMFATPKEICKGFGLGKFVKFNWEFFIEVLGGWFCNDMPNPNKAFYLLVTDEEDMPPVIDENTYKENEWAKSNYARVTTLENSCRRYSKSLQVPDKRIFEFIEIMNKRILIAGTANA